MAVAAVSCAACAAFNVVFAMARPDAAIALASPVGFLWLVLPRRQGNFFSFEVPLVETLLENDVLQHAQAITTWADGCSRINGKQCDEVQQKRKAR